MIFNLRTIFSDILVVRQIYFHVKNFSGVLFSVPFAVCRWLKMLERDTEKKKETEFSAHTQGHDERLRWKADLCCILLSNAFGF